MIRATLAALALLGAAPSQGDVPPAVAQEWRVREWALDPRAHSAAIEAASRASEWNERHAAFDALARSAPGSIAREHANLARSALRDEHPNVRAQALAALAAHSLAIGEGGADLVRDSLPGVRRELARAVARIPGEESDRILLTLEGDEDSRVSVEASDQIFGRGPDSVDAQLALWRRGRFDADAAAFLRALDVLERSPGNGPLYRAVQKHLGDREDPARQVLWCSVYPVNSGRYRDHPVEGWLLPLGPEHSLVERDRRARLLEAAGLAKWLTGLSLLDAACEADRSARSGADASHAAERASELLSFAIAGLYGTAEKSRESSRARYGSKSWIHATWSWSPEFAVEFFEGCAGLATAWSKRDSDWLEPEIDPEIRAAAVDAFADAWTRTRDATSGELLAIALGDPDPDLAHGAWVALAGADEGIRAFGRPLYEAWATRPLEARLADLRQVHRGAPLDSPWREELVRLWASGEGRTVSVIELLGAHVGDEDVVSLLWNWLSRVVEALESGPVPGEETTRGPWREAETSALWLVRGWLRATASKDVERAAELLGRVGKLGKEVGKVLAAELAKSREGRRAMESLLATDLLSRRLRIEVLLLDEDLDEEGDLALLFERFDACDEELKLRIAKRLGGLATPRSRELLHSVVLDPGASIVVRGAALDALAGAGAPREVAPLLESVLGTGGDLDLRRAAVSALGGVGGERSAAALHELLATADGRRYLGDVLLPALAAIETRGGKPPSPRLVEAWILEARRAAPRELELRFRGQRLSSRVFAYSGMIGALEAFARAGVLDDALEGTGPWWRLDARLLLEMAARAAEAGGAGAAPAARRLNRAALVGLLGEGDAPDRAGLIARARARLLRLAWRARDWREAEGYATDLLEDWRTGRTTENGFQAVFGSRDVDAERDPTGWLLASRAQARAWIALEAGDSETARDRAKDGARESHISRAAREQQEELEKALE